MPKLSDNDNKCSKNIKFHSGEKASTLIDQSFVVSYLFNGYHRRVNQNATNKTSFSDKASLDTWIIIYKFFHSFCDGEHEENHHNSCGEHQRLFFAQLYVRTVCGDEDSRSFFDCLRPNEYSTTKRDIHDERVQGTPPVSAAN
jgi:hypothetical protein